MTEASPGSTRIVWTIPSGVSGRLDRALVKAFPQHSRARFQAWIAEGQVWLDGVAALPSAPVRPGQKVVVDVPPPVASRLDPEQLDVPVLYEDEDVAVVVKPAGMATHPAPGHSTGTLVHALLGQMTGLSAIGGEERPGIVHRLDIGTSGVMVVAKNDLAHRALAADFAAHRIERRYLAVVHRVPLHDAGTITSRLARDPKNRLKMASVREALPDAPDEPVVQRWGDPDDVDELDEAPEPAEARRQPYGRLAITHWRLLARADRMALVTCQLETGRTHQVRVHLSESGHPIVGDAVYARRDCVAPAGLRDAVSALNRPLLHAFRLGFTHPRSGASLRYDAPVPADFVAFCALASLPIPALATIGGGPRLRINNPK